MKFNMKSKVICRVFFLILISILNVVADVEVENNQECNECILYTKYHNLLEKFNSQNLDYLVNLETNDISIDLATSDEEANVYSELKNLYNSYKDMAYYLEEKLSFLMTKKVEGFKNAIDLKDLQNISSCFYKEENNAAFCSDLKIRDDATHFFYSFPELLLAIKCISEKIKNNPSLSNVEKKRLINVKDYIYSKIRMKEIENETKFNVILKDDQKVPLIASKKEKKFGLLRFRIKKEEFSDNSYFVEICFKDKAVKAKSFTFPYYNLENVDQLNKLRSIGFFKEIQIKSGLNYTVGLGLSKIKKNDGQVLYEISIDSINLEKTLF